MGTRMIGSVIDGLSRGNNMGGMMRGLNHLYGEGSVGGMGHIVKKGGKNPGKGDIMFDGSCVDMFMKKITVRRSCTHIHKRNPKKLGGGNAEGRNIPFHGNFEGAV